MMNVTIEEKNPMSDCVICQFPFATLATHILAIQKIALNLDIV